MAKLYPLLTKIGRFFDFLLYQTEKWVKKMKFSTKISIGSP